MSRPRRAAAAGLVLLTTAVVAAPAPARAEGPPATAWWSQTKLGPPAPAPEAPDTVPEGGTQVASDPSGEVSVAALRVELPVGVIASELRLPVARSVGTPAVEACPTAVRWQPNDGARLDAAPAAACDVARSLGTVEGEELVVPLAALQRDGAVDLLLRPVEGSAFVLDLGPATASSVRTSSSGSGDPDPDRAPAPPPAPDLPPPPAPPPGPAEGSADLGPLAGLPEAPAPDLAAAPLPVVVDPAPAAVPEVAAPLAAAPTPAPPLVARPAAALPDTRGEQLAALALLAGLAVLAARLLVQPTAAPRMLGGGARLRGLTPAEPARKTEERGLGRFRAPRDRPPVRL